MVVVVALIGMIAAIVIPALDVNSSMRPANERGSGVLGIVLVAYWFAWLRKAKRPWVWVLMAFLGFLLVSAVGGALRGYSETQVEKERYSSLVDAMATLDPRAAAQIRELQDQQSIQRAMAPFLIRAIQKAPDAAVVAFGAAQVRMLAPTSASDLARCAGAARGTGSSTDAVSAHMQADFLDATSALIRAAANNDETPAVPTVEDVRPLLLPIYARVDPSGFADDASKFAKLSDNDQCQMFLSTRRAIGALAPADAALVLRFLAGARKQ